MNSMRRNTSTDTYGVLYTREDFENILGRSFSEDEWNLFRASLKGFENYIGSEATAYILDIFDVMNINNEQGVPLKDFICHAENHNSLATCNGSVSYLNVEKKLQVKEDLCGKPVYYCEDRHAWYHIDNSTNYVEVDCYGNPVLVGCNIVYHQHIGVVEFPADWVFFEFRILEGGQGFGPSPFFISFLLPKAKHGSWQTHMPVIISLHGA